MRWITKAAMRIRMLFRRSRAGEQLDEELRFHLEREIAENLAAGMTPSEARYAALRSFGNPALVREQARETWSWGWLEQAWRDVCYGVRTLRRTPGFTVIAVVVIALGIGANVALFTVVRGVLLRPLPFREPDRLMEVYENNLKGDSELIVAGGMYSEWRSQNRTFSSMALLQGTQAAMSSGGGRMAENLTGARVTWNLLSTLGVQPALGRDFTAADDSPAANGTVLLSWSLWNRRFNADRGVLNQTIYLDTKPYTVIGVMPKWFAFPQPRTEVWMPVYHEIPARRINMVDVHGFSVVGRLRPGVSASEGAADLSAISLRVHNAHLDLPFVRPAASVKPLLEHMVGELKRPLYVLLAATCCLLLIACLNVGNLLVARAAARRKELAVRIALGGGRLRLLRERMMESLILSALGGALGLAFASVALGWFAAARHDMSRIESIRIDGVVAAFTIGVVLLCALFAGLISGLTVQDRQILETLQESSRSAGGSHSRATLRRVLLAVEVGLTVVLLIGAGLLVKSYEHLRSEDMGCITKNVLTMRIGLPGARYKTPGPAPAEFFDRLLAQTRALPGVTAVGLVEAVPGQGWWEDSTFSIVEHPPLPRGSALDAINRTADSGYFAAMGIPILKGRTFNDSLRLELADEIIVSDSLARKYFPGEEALGKHIKTEERTYTVVGVVGDSRFETGSDPWPIKYFSYHEGRQNYGTLVIRADGDVERQALPVQRVLQQLDRDVYLADILTMDQLLGKSVLDQSFNTTLLSGFAGLSLLLAAAGLFGVLSYIATQRTREIGIRLALGAPRQLVLGEMLSDGLRPAIAGLALGMAAGAAASRLMSSMLYETKPFDPAVFTAVSAALVLVAALACVVPAWRASRINPIEALRAE